MQIADTRSGIYSIKHLDTGKEYIGSSVNIRNRIKAHLKSLRRGKHHSPYLQRFWNKHGPSSFEVKVLFVCKVDDLKYYEQKCLDFLIPVFNGSKNANSPVHRGQKLPDEWKEKIICAIRNRYAAGFKIKHPPRSEEQKLATSKKSKEKWLSNDYREKVTVAIQESMTLDECSKRSERSKKLWADDEYRQHAIASRIGKAYNKGYKCTPEQIENRRKAARISNMKRNYGENWKQEYIRRYPENKGDLNAL